MQTMTETLMALLAQDDALARRLFQWAPGAVQKWPEGFVTWSHPLCRARGGGQMVIWHSSSTTATECRQVSSAAQNNSQIEGCTT
jgi:hypothetical protein